ncbi:MAG: FkbM family methyltransferase [Gemmataceae bacterium]|nr:FkbM family methyltransferase [Gemmataceae bacterium]
MADATPRRTMSKRDFLFGAAGGAAAGIAALQAGRAIATTPKPPPAFRPSFAQAGEDAVVSFIFAYLKLDQPSYIDIGAADPVKWNNTYYFYLQGCRGILVEPNVDLIPKLKAERPDDTILNIGIGPENTTADYYRLSEPGWNTFDKDEAEEAIRNSGGRERVVEVVKMPLVNVNDVLAKHYGGKTPDFFSIDVEGLDLAILKSLDWAKHRPKVICVETVVNGTTGERSEVAAFLDQKGFAARASTFINTVFVDKGLLR